MDVRLDDAAGMPFAPVSDWSVGQPRNQQRDCDPGDENQRADAPSFQRKPRDAGDEQHNA